MQPKRLNFNHTRRVVIREKSGQKSRELEQRNPCESGQVSERVSERWLSCKAKATRFDTVTIALLPLSSPRPIPKIAQLEAFSILHPQTELSASNPFSLNASQLQPAAATALTDNHRFLLIRVGLLSPSPSSVVAYRRNRSHSTPFDSSSRPARPVHSSPSTCPALTVALPVIVASHPHRHSAFCNRKKSSSTSLPAPTPPLATPPLTDP